MDLRGGMDLPLTQAFRDRKDFPINVPAATLFVRQKREIHVIISQWNDVNVLRLQNLFMAISRTGNADKPNVNFHLKTLYYSTIQTQ